MKVLFCIVSDQPAANLISMQEINPDNVMLAATQRMMDKAENLKIELGKMGKRAEVIPIAQEDSLQALYQQYEAWIENNLDKYDDIVVNITRGNKLMSLAAFNLFSGFGIRCCYQSLNPNQLIWLDDETRVSNVGHKIGLDRYLAMHRVNVIDKQPLAAIPKSHKVYAQILYDALCRPGLYAKTLSVIGKINAHTADKKQDLTYFRFNEEDLALLQSLKDASGLFDFTTEDVQCEDLEAKALMNGGWLECIAADFLRGTNCRDISRSVRIQRNTQRTSSQTAQEMDVMAMRENKLILVECKTKKWQNATDASDAIYKLSALDNIGGLNTEAIFISLHNLPDAAKTRAAEMGVRLICGDSGIRNMKNRLSEPNDANLLNL